MNSCGSRRAALRPWSMWRSAMLAVALLMSVPALAEPPAPYTCRNGGFPGQDSEGFHQAVVVGQPGSRAYLFDDDVGCPTAASCKSGTFFEPGTRVLTSLVRDGWVCVYHSQKSNGGNDEAGWMMAEHLRIQPEPPIAPASAWQGIWIGGGEITITSGAHPKEISVDGKTFWTDGVNDRFGNMSGIATVETNRIHLVDGSCEAWMTLLVDVLIVNDNRRCGALNARFSGVFLRKGRRVE